MEKNIFDFTAIDSKGNEHPLSQYRGKALLIVNTASKCGFTPQFEGLEELYRKYADKGLMIIGFPCSQFANQELDSNEASVNFCQRNYGVTFPMMGKVDVNGDNASEIFEYLKSRAGGWLGNRIKWNFTKFLISPDGKRVERFAPVTKPASIEGAIRKALGLE